MLRFARSFVGADAHIGPLKCCEFASDFRKNGQFRRADRLVRPYGAKSKPDAITPIRPTRGVSVLGWVDVGIDPYGMESEIPPHVGADAHIGPSRCETGDAAIFAGRVRFFIPLVGADDSVRPLKCFEFALDLRKNGHFPAGGQGRPPLRCKMGNRHGFAGKPP